MMFRILKILLMISPFVSFQQKPFWHAKSFPWLLTSCWSTNDHCFIVLCATFLKLFFIFWHIVALCFLFSRVEYNASHKSFKLTAYLLIKQTDWLAGVHGDQNITNICLKKTVKQLQYPAVIVLTKTRGELQTFPALLNVTQKTTFSSPCSDKSVAYCTTYLQKCRPDWWRPLNLMNEKKLFLSTHVYDEEKSIFAQNQNLQLQHILNLLW